MRKRSIASAVLTLGMSLSVYALDNIGINQSYYVTEKGRPVTIKSEIPGPNSGFATTWSPNEFFYAPELVDTFGGRYILMDDSNLIHTLDSQGNMYKTMTAYSDSGAKIKGSQYFISRRGSLYVILNDGKVKSYTEEGYQEKFRNVREKNAGGMFFLMDRKIVVPNPFNGRLEILADDPEGKMTVKGDNYFLTDENEFYMVGYTKTNGPRGEDFYPRLIKDTLPSNIGNIIKSGGNFFFDTGYNLHAITDDARFRTIGKVNGKEGELPVKIGGNYMIYADGSLYQVDEQGQLNFIQTVSDRIIATNK